jgi:Ca2+-binding RTX toxin-like protein
MVEGGVVDRIYGGDGGDEIEITLPREAEPDFPMLDSVAPVSMASPAMYISSGTGDDYIGIDYGSITLYAGDGNDYVEYDADGPGDSLEAYLGAGDDEFDGNDAGNVTVFGGDGDDLFYGGDGTDYFSGGAGDDMIYGYAGDDLIFSGAGNDSVDVRDGNHQIRTGDGNDSILLDGDGNHLVYGGSGNDEITSDGFEGTKTLHGGAGDDQIFINAEFAEVYGGTGDDLIEFVYGGSLYGGSGMDTFQWNRDASFDRFGGEPRIIIEDFEHGVDVLDIGSNANLLAWDFFAGNRAEILIQDSDSLQTLTLVMDFTGNTLGDIVNDIGVSIT